MGLLMQSSMIEKENIIMNVLLSTTTIDSSADFAEYHNGVEAAYKQINMPDFRLKEAFESFHFDPAETYFQQGFFDAVSHELDKLYEAEDKAELKRQDELNRLADDYHSNELQDLILQYNS